MDKMNDIENLKTIQNQIVKEFGCSEFVKDPDMNEDLVREKVFAFLFDRVKSEIASRLSLVEAIFVASNALHDVEVLKMLFDFMKDLHIQLYEFIEDFRGFEEGGMQDEEN